MSQANPVGNKPRSKLVRATTKIPVVTPKHDMRALGYGDNGEGDEGQRSRNFARVRQARDHTA